MRICKIMVHGYHIVLPHYGFWLPNDPRGSWSEFVASWEIARFGDTTRHLEQRYTAEQIANLLKGAATRRSRGKTGNGLRPTLGSTLDGQLTNNPVEQLAVGVPAIKDVNE